MKPLAHAARLAFACAALAASLGACSLLLDLEADCTPADCNGFQCAPSGDVCLQTCRRPDECAPGFVCDDLSGAGGACLPRTCAPLSNIGAFFPGAAITRNVDATADASTLAAAFVTTSGEVRFKRYDTSNGAAGEDLVVAAANPEARDPAIAASPGGWGLVWRSAELVGGARRDVLRYAFVTAGGALAVTPRNLWIAGFPANFQEKSVDNPDILWDDEAQAFAVVFASRLASNSELFLLRLRAEGTALDGSAELPHDAARQITLTPGGSALEPRILLRALPDDPDLYDVVYRVGAGDLGLSMSTVSGDAQRPGGADLLLSPPGAGPSIDRFAPAALPGNQRAIAWVDADALRRVLVTPDRALAATPRAFAQDLPDPLGIDLAAAQDGASFATAHTATYGAQRDVYLARFANDGSRIAPPFPLGVAAEQPASPRLFPTPAGFLITWEANDGDRAGRIAGQYWSCADR